MQNHPLTPMTDTDIGRWLAPQTKHGVGHVAAAHVFDGAEAIKHALEAEHAAGKRLIVVDALRDTDLIEIGKTVDQLPLVTCGSSVALGLPGNFARRGRLSQTGAPWRGLPDKCAALSGSGSTATRRQITLHRLTDPIIEIKAGDVIIGELAPQTVTEWLLQAKGVSLAYSSADPEAVATVQARFGRAKSGAALETFFATLARQLVAAGVGKVLTAGGETSGAIVEGLQLKTHEIDLGVPALRGGTNV